MDERCVGGDGDEGGDAVSGDDVPLLMALSLACLAASDDDDDCVSADDVADDVVACDDACVLDSTCAMLPLAS